MSCWPGYGHTFLGGSSPSTIADAGRLTGGSKFASSRPGDDRLPLGGAVPKITDFGLAKQLDEVGQTASGAIMGTPSYMAPEQASGETKLHGPAADIYALGAILYECLTGRPPFKAVNSLETIMLLIGSEPVPPSQLNPRTPRDLETICLKCLQKEPRKRYASAADLADDLARFEKGEPIAARPIGVIERSWRWCRRKPAVAGLLALVALVALTGAVAVLHQLKRAVDAEADQRSKAAALTLALKDLDTKAEELKNKADDLEKSNVELAAAKIKADEARIAAEKAQALADKGLKQNEKINALLQSIFAEIDPRAEIMGGPLLRQQLTRRLLQVADQLNEEAIGDPLTVARMQSFLGLTLDNLGESAKAVEILRKAHATREKLLGPDDPDTLANLNTLALGHLHSGRMDLAGPLLQQLLEKKKKTLGPDHPETLQATNNLAGAYFDAGRLDLALPLFQEVLEKMRAKAGSDDNGTLFSMSNLARAYAAAKKINLALPLYQEALQRRKAKFGPDHLDTLSSLNSLASAYHESGKLNLALPLYQEAVQRMKAKLGADHPLTLTTMTNLGVAYIGLRQLKTAVAIFQETLEKRKIKLGPDHPETLTSMNYLAHAYELAGRMDLALPLYQQSLEKRKQRLGPDHPETLKGMQDLVKAHVAAKQADRAAAVFEEYLAQHQMAIPPQALPRLTEALERLVQLYESQGKTNEANRWRKELAPRKTKK